MSDEKSKPEITHLIDGIHTRDVLDDSCGETWFDFDDGVELVMWLKGLPMQPFKTPDGQVVGAPMLTRITFRVETRDYICGRMEGCDLPINDVWIRKDAIAWVGELGQVQRAGGIIKPV